METIKRLQDKDLVVVFFICCLRMVNSQVNFSAPCNGVQIMDAPLYNPSANIRQVSGMFARAEFNVNDSKPGGLPATFQPSFYPLVFTVDLSPNSDNEVEIKSVQLSNSTNIRDMDMRIIKQNNIFTSPTFLATSRLIGDDPIAYLAAGTTGKAVQISVFSVNNTKPLSFDIDIRACLAVCLVWETRTSILVTANNHQQYQKTLLVGLVFSCDSETSAGDDYELKPWSPELHIKYGLFYHSINK